MLLRAVSRLLFRPSTDESTPSSGTEWNDSYEAKASAKRVIRQRKVFAGIYEHVWKLRALLVIVGIGWLLVLPFDELGRSAYMDENAVQPAQTTTYWNWDDVHTADRYLDKLEELVARNASSEERSGYLLTEFQKLGIASSTSSFNYTYTRPPISGTNTYLTLSPPRASGVETVLISANWKSLTGGWNLRGVAQVMSLARFLRGQNHWAKDFVFVFGEGYIEGVEAFLSSYHGIPRAGLEVEPLDLAPQGVIWAALNIDYPGHSFSHLGLYYEGVNGVLPNQDLLNAITNIARWTGGVPVQLHSVSDDLIPPPLPFSLPTSPDISHDLNRYYRGLRHLSTHFAYAGFGKHAGAHGTFAKYRIEGVTLFAEPAIGPHGFHAFGLVIESTLRSINNLLERFHASFFFYLLPHPGWFIKIGNYLPAAILIGAGLTIGGLNMWVGSGWVRGHRAVSGGEKVKAGRVTEWRRRGRRLDLVMVGVGGAVLAALGNLWAQTGGEASFGKYIFPFGGKSHLPAFPSTIITSLLLATLISALTSTPKQTNALATTARDEKNAIALALAASAHILGGAVVTALAMINFPQAILLGLGLTISFGILQLDVDRLTRASSSITRPPNSHKINRYLRLALFQLLTPEGLSLLGRLFLPSSAYQSLETHWAALLQDRVIVGNKFAEGLFVVYWGLGVVVCTAGLVEIM